VTQNCDNTITIGATAGSVDTNTVIASGYGLGTNTTLKTPTLTNAVVQGMTNLWQIDYATYTNSLTSTTNLVLDFAYPSQIISVTTNVYWVNSTNRPNAGYSRYTDVTIINNSGGNLTMSLASLSANWKPLGTIPTTITNGYVLQFSAKCWGPYETNICFGAAN
jgi:hypothetical protein